MFLFWEDALGRKMSVGLVALTDIPNIGLVTILQKRGEFNHETMSPESYPGACQVTFHGEAERFETPINTLLREATEEMGERFKEILEYTNFIEIDRIESEEKLVVTYACKLPYDFLRNIRLNASSGGIRLLKENEIEQIQNIKNFNRKTGIIDRTVIAMFADEKEAIQKSFEKLKNA